MFSSFLENRFRFRFEIGNNKYFNTVHFWHMLLQCVWYVSLPARHAHRQYSGEDKACLARMFDGILSCFMLCPHWGTRVKQGSDCLEKPWTSSLFFFHHKRKFRSVAEEAWACLPCKGAPHFHRAGVALCGSGKAAQTSGILWPRMI